MEVLIGESLDPDDAVIEGDAPGRLRPIAEVVGRVAGVVFGQQITGDPGFRFGHVRRAGLGPWSGP